MSPHLSVWRWHVTMATSILHRASGVALYVAALIGAAWALSLASGPEAYANFKALMASPLGLLVLFGLTAATFFHLANGIRHLIWDFGYGLEKQAASNSSWVVFGFAAAATIAVWAIARQTGAFG